MAHLPHDLIVEIMVWLPVKSLMRFRCLSKSFCAVIDSPDFIKSHLCKSSQNFNRRKLIYKSRGKFYLLDVNFDLVQEIPPLGELVSSLRGEVCGHCNGLILFYRSEIGFSLYNPSTRQYRDLPDCPFKGVFKSGLGYDESIDDYKVVVRVSDDKGLETQVWVYVLKSNIWRKTQNFSGKFRGIGCFTDGSLHWLCRLPGDSKSKDIVAFDMSKETFSIVPHPCSIKFGFPLRLHVLEGCLCISQLPLSPPRAYFYIRKKDGVDKFTWTRVYSITQPWGNDDGWFTVLSVLGYSNGGDNILLHLGGEDIVSYDLKTESFRKVKMENDPSWCGPVTCLESLVPIGSGS